MENKHNQAFVEGRRPVLELFRAGTQINCLYIAKGAQQGSIRKIIHLAKENQVTVKEIQRDFLDELCENRNHQGVAAAVAPIEYCSLETLLESSPTRFYLVLAGIQDPHNLGSLIRSAEICGAAGVIIPNRRGVAVTPAVVHASAGALAHIPVCRVTNVVNTLKRLKEVGCWIVGGDMEGEVCYKQNLALPLALVIGGEGGGLPRLVKETCDFLIKIPMYGSISSFNAGVAGGILLYEAARQKKDNL